MDNHGLVWVFMRSTEPSSTAKHKVIAESLRAQIKRGDFKDRLPSRRELARSFQVNFKTIDKALGTLQKERVVLLRKGLGVFVHPALKGKVVNGCFFVFPGHKIIADPANISRFLVIHTLEQLLSSAHELQVELKFLPISPLNNHEINWNLLAHLRKGDCALFLGVQYWDVIKKLARRGCRCLVLSDNPANSGLVAGGLPLMSVDVDYLAMMQALVDYFLHYGCRHPAAVTINPWKNRRLWPPIFKRLAHLCRRNGMKFSLQDGIALPRSDDDLADCLDRLFRQAPAMDAIFATRELEGRRIRNVLDQRFPAKSRSLRVISFDNDCTWCDDHHGVDALQKPLDEMIRCLMEVVCEKRTFESGHLAFPARLKTANGDYALRKEKDNPYGRNQDKMPLASESEISTVQEINK